MDERLATNTNASMERLATNTNASMENISVSIKILERIWFPDTVFYNGRTEGIIVIISLFLLVYIVIG
jgi:hypothetical protein